MTGKQNHDPDDYAGEEVTAEKSEVVEEKASGENVDQYVQYVGGSDIRKISAEDWKSLGVDDQAEVVWGPENGKRVPVGELSEKARELLKNNSMEFRDSAGDLPVPEKPIQTTTNPMTGEPTGDNH